MRSHNLDGMCARSIVFMYRYRMPVSGFDLMVA